MPQRVAIITGASRGIGRAAAVEMARRGWAVSLIARSAGDLDHTAYLCHEAGGRAVAFAADITDERVLASAVSRTAEELGRIDGVLNNAGYAPQAGVEETDAALFAQAMAVNLSSAMALSRLAWPHLKLAASHRVAGAADQPGAPSAGSCIVNISSMSAVDPRPGLVAYAAAKAGLLGLTRALAREGDEHNIRSVAIILGAVETEMFRGLRGTENVPPEALLTPAEVATVIADCLAGQLKYSSGEGIYLRKRI